MPTKTSLASLSADELNAEIARRQQDEEKAAAQRAERLATAQRAWDAETFAGYHETDKRLLAETDAARERFTAAVRAGDLAAAFAAWTTERRLRFTRTSLRDTARQSAEALGEPTIDLGPDLRYYDPDFLTRLMAEADQAAQQMGYADVADHIGERPTEVE